MMPLARRAKQNGTFAGWSVTTSVQGGEPKPHHAEHVLPTTSRRSTVRRRSRRRSDREGVAEFLRKGAGLINQVEQSVLKRVPDLSY